PAGHSTATPLMAESLVSSLQPLGLSARRAALVDFFYHWFSELQAQGEETNFRLGSVCGSSEPVWVELPHHSFDGLGGLAHTLAQRFGAELAVPTLPGPYPGPLLRWVAALRLLFRRAPHLLPWRHERPAPDTLGRPVGAWQLLTTDMTSELRERA